MQSIQVFLEHPQAELVLLLLGGVLCLIGFIQVVRKGIALLFWLLLFTVGLVPVLYVFSTTQNPLLNTARETLGGVSDTVPAITNEVLERWCGRLEEVCR